MKFLLSIALLFLPFVSYTQETNDSIHLENKIIYTKLSSKDPIVGIYLYNIVGKELYRDSILNYNFTRIKLPRINEKRLVIIITINNELSYIKSFQNE